MILPGQNAPFSGSFEAPVAPIGGLLVLADGDQVEGWDVEGSVEVCEFNFEPAPAGRQILDLSGTGKGTLRRDLDVPVNVADDARVVLEVCVAPNGNASRSMSIEAGTTVLPVVVAPPVAPDDRWQTLHVSAPANALRDADSFAFVSGEAGVQGVFLDAIVVGLRLPGLRRETYDVAVNSLPSVFENTRAPDRVDVVPGFDIDGDSGRVYRFAGSIGVRSAGVVTFRVRSDDGVALFVDGGRVLINDGVHSESEVEGSVALSRGEHLIDVRYFNGPDNGTLQVQWREPGDVAFVGIPASRLHTLAP